ncbi:hypothetical protein Tco_0175037 [Tanacetum coccineum]
MLGVKQMTPKRPEELQISLSPSNPVSKATRTVADSIAERLTRPTAYKFKTDCSIIPVWPSREDAYDSDVDEGPMLLSLSWPTCHPLVQPTVKSMRNCSSEQIIGVPANERASLTL